MLTLYNKCNPLENRYTQNLKVLVALKFKSIQSIIDYYRYNILYFFSHKF